MRGAILGLALLAGCARSEAPPAAADASAAAAVAQPVAASDPFPVGKARDVLMGKCQICHSLEYVSQQRLTPQQWEATLAKMAGWGAPIDDAERALLAGELSSRFGPDTPEVPRRLVPTPQGGRP